MFYSLKTAVGNDCCCISFSGSRFPVNRGKDRCSAVHPWESRDSRVAEIHSALPGCLSPLPVHEPLSAAVRQEEKGRSFALAPTAGGTRPKAAHRTAVVPPALLGIEGRAKTPLRGCCCLCAHEGVDRQRSTHGRIAVGKAEGLAVHAPRLRRVRQL